MKSFLNHLFLVFLFLHLTNAFKLHAQNLHGNKKDSSRSIIVTGKVMDKTKGTVGIPFATISVINESKVEFSTTTDVHGDFQFLYPILIQANDTLEIKASSIGYLARAIRLAMLKFPITDSLYFYLSRDPKCNPGVDINAIPVRNVK